MKKYLYWLLAFAIGCIVTLGFSKGCGSKKVTEVIGSSTEVVSSSAAATTSEVKLQEEVLKKTIYVPIEVGIKTPDQEIRSELSVVSVKEKVTRHDHKKPCKPVQEPCKDEEKPVVNNLVAVNNPVPMKLVMIYNNCGKDYEVVVFETFLDGRFKKDQVRLISGGHHGIGLCPDATELTLGIKVMKGCKVKYEIKAHHFCFDVSARGKDIKEKFIWNIEEKEKKSCILIGQ